MGQLYDLTCQREPPSKLLLRSSWSFDVPVKSSSKKVRLVVPEEEEEEVKYLVTSRRVVGFCFRRSKMFGSLLVRRKDVRVRSALPLLFALGTKEDVGTNRTSS